MQIFTLKNLAPLLLFWLSFCYGTNAIIKSYNFQIDYANYTVGCVTKQIIAVNGQSPGPTIRVTRGDRVIINVTNLVSSNISIHWHGINQRLSPWSDGPAYITQCPIQTGRSYIYNFTVPDQQGTLFWHAHISWLRGTVYGAIVIDPSADKQLPFTTPDGDHVLTLGEWWNDDIENVENRARINGLAADLSNAYLINGHAGPFYNCSTNDTEIVNVKKGTTHLLRVINNALETDLFITIANHSLTVVETDASYTKQITNTTFLISPGQTYSFLVNANQAIGQYYIVISPYERSSQGVQEIPAVAILRYNGANISKTPVYPDNVPLKNESIFFEKSQTEIKSLNSKAYPSEVPQEVNISLYWVLSLNVEPCTVVPGISNCLGPAGMSFASSINNITFQKSDVAILQAYYHNTPGIYTTDFPRNPSSSYDYTGQQLDISSLVSTTGTKVVQIPYGSNVQLVFQGTINFQSEAHPFHLHGNDFYVVGYGDGNYDPNTHPASFNLVDPSKRNTAMVTKAGWTAVRWKADNPGVWLIHCHFDGHVSWGMETAFIVTNGALANEMIPGPPSDLPSC